jgi:hypothetical protein
MYSKQFGGKITKEHTAQYQQSPNWKNGKFQNIEDTSLHISLSKMPGIIYRQFTGKAEREPSQPLPILPFDKQSFLQTSDAPKMIWYGHSVLLLRINDKTILIDPMLGPNASPIGPVTTRRFSENTLDLIDNFPEIDLLLLTHDHYDHLDYDSIQKLKAKTKRYFVAMGVKRHLAPLILHGWNAGNTMCIGTKFICIRKNAFRQLWTQRRPPLCPSIGQGLHWRRIIGKNRWNDLWRRQSRLN